MQYIKLAVKIGGWASIVLAVVVLTISLFWYRHARSFVQSASRTQGTIVKLAEKNAERESYPVFSFHDGKGHEHEVESSVGQYPPAYKVGEVVAVLYQPDKPDNAKLDSFSDIWVWPVILGGFGVFNFVVGLVILWVSVKIQESSHGTFTNAQSGVITPQNATLEVSYPKALLVSVAAMICFVIGIVVEGIPMSDPLIIGFLVFMVTGMSFVFAGCLCFMLRCKIGHDGLCPSVPTFYQRVLRWEDIASVQGFASPFFFVRCRAFGGHCLLPRRFLLRRPDNLKEYIEQYAPADNIVRKKLATNGSSIKH